MSITQWHQFLQDSSITNVGINHSQLLIQDHKVISFGNTETEREAVSNDTTLCDLSHLGLLQVEGIDAITFLQGQVTNDVKQLNGHNAHYTAYCNPKGRMLALFLAFSHHDHVHLQMPKELIESIAKRLKMYVMRSKVTIQDVSDTIIKIGLNGPRATELLSSVFSQVPQQHYELVTLENGALLRLPSDKPRFEIFTDISNAPAIWNALSRHAKPVGSACWEWLEIQAGIPDITLNTQETFVPQMLNLDLLGGINFKKGCYTGQEIVARTHYLGTVKRRTYLAHTTADTQITVSDDILNSAGEAIGKVVRSALAPDGGYDVLAEIRSESVSAGAITVNGETLVLQALPYAII